jgi:hypothetical protein
MAIVGRQRETIGVGPALRGHIYWRRGRGGGDRPALVPSSTSARFAMKMPDGGIHSSSCYLATNRKNEVS